MTSFKNPWTLISKSIRPGRTAAIALLWVGLLVAPPASAISLSPPPGVDNPSPASIRLANVDPKALNVQAFSTSLGFDPGCQFLNCLEPRNIAFNNPVPAFLDLTPGPSGSLEVSSGSAEIELDPGMSPAIDLVPEGSRSLQMAPPPNVQQIIENEIHEIFPFSSEGCILGSAGLIDVLCNAGASSNPLSAVDMVCANSIVSTELCYSLQRSVLDVIDPLRRTIANPIETRCSLLNTVCTTAAAHAAVICSFVGKKFLGQKIGVHFCGGVATAGGHAASPNPFNASVSWHADACGGQAVGDCRDRHEMSGVCAYNCGNAETVFVGQNWCFQMGSTGCRKASYWVEVETVATGESYLIFSLLRVGPLETSEALAYDDEFANG